MTIFLAFLSAYSIAILISLIYKNKDLKKILYSKDQSIWELELENALLHNKLKEEQDDEYNRG